MRTSIELATEIFNNARIFKVIRHQLPDFAPVDELIRESGRWFSALRDEEDSYAAVIRTKVWRLRSTVVLTLLPFDHEDLKLEKQLEEIRDETDYVPFLAEPMQRLANIISFLINNPTNQKREKIFEILRELKDPGTRVGLVSALTRGPTPGWSKSLRHQIDEAAPHCELIINRRQLTYKTYQQIILTSRGRNSPLLYDLYHGCRTPQLDVVVYKCEGIQVPERMSLPEATLLKSRVTTVRGRVEHDHSDTDDVKLEKWIERRFWESIRETTVKQDYTEHQDRDRQFLVRARIVLLANNTRVCLRDDMKVIEISDLIDRRIDIEEYGKQFPRRRVDQLREGDLIVLRTSGSGDYLHEVADSLMKKDGKRQLRTTALDWKAFLENALRDHGSEKIARLLEKKGHSLRSHSYVWMWTSDIVIRPQCKFLFRDLMVTMYELGYKVDDKDAVESATIRWNEMREIIHYHLRAGMKIRQSLLNRLRELIEKGVKIADSYHLTLPDVSAGEMSVFRIAAVDTEAIDVPYHHVGVIMDMEE